MLTTPLTHPEILRHLATCGHGDLIAIVDSNYPAHTQRTHYVPLVSLNVTHGVPTTALVTQLVAQTVPVEKCTIPAPVEESSQGSIRTVHSEIQSAVLDSNQDAELATVAPGDFYGLTSSPSLAFMIVTGERSHYGSTLLTVGYLPEL